jgi:hypothetical protein
MALRLRIWACGSAIAAIAEKCWNIAAASR